MTNPSENLDFSGLFKLDVLVHLEIVTHSFYEVGLKKFLAFASNKELIFLYVNPQGERSDKHYDWDFLDNPIYCMCFEPSGTWVLIVSEEKVLLVPYLPLFTPQYTFDLKWSLTSVTVLPLGIVPNPLAVVWWLTKESENILIIASKTKSIHFYSLENQTIIAECKVSGDITDLQICCDDSLDLLTLLVSGNNTQQWKLVLEHRSMNYNWLHQTRAQNEKDKKEGFMNYIKQLSKDKITLFTQGGSKDDKSTVEYVLKPTEYLPLFRKGSNNWALTAQYVNGRHFLTAFELNEGTLILESPEEETPSRTLRPHIKKDGLYIQGLWSQRLVYLLKKNELEVHSASFSVIQGDGLLGAKREFSELWKAEVIGEVRRGYLMSVKEPPPMATGWKEPTFLCDLQLPRFNLEPCLIITDRGAFLMTTVCEPCEWLVGVIMRGGVGAEQSAAGLGAPVPALLRASADMLLARGKLEPAHYLYSLSQSQPDGWVARLGVFERLHELSTYKQTGNVGTIGNSAITIKLLAALLKLATDRQEHFDMDISGKLTSLTATELEELSAICAAIGLWDVLPMFSIHRGHPNLMLSAIKSRKDVCRGAVCSLLSESCLVRLLLEENTQWLFHFITGHCDKFDLNILKRLCLWLNPLQDQLRPVMRDLKQGITSLYTTRLMNLITTFIHVASEIESRDPCRELQLNSSQNPDTWLSQYAPRRSVSCGLAHWALVDDGNAKVMMTNTPINTELIGRVIDAACGRHHTLVLTENGLYASGDNTYGQLGVGAMWGGAIGDAAHAAGALLHVAREWTAPLTHIAAGHYHSAAIDAGGRLYTWGWGVHGQLGLGNIDDQCTPQLVTKFQGRKVVSVGCGACHTVALTMSGEVWAMGAGAFGQLGGGAGARHKSSLPVRVTLPQPVTCIAVGYFHSLALTSGNVVWTWGASPQQIRAAHSRRGSPDTPDSETHLAPQPVDTANVQGEVVKLSAGWHHSCIMDNYGKLYSWGLNFDGQLGSGDRKQIHVPSPVKFRNDSKHERSPEIEDRRVMTKALVACGGDFTIYIDDNGRVYGTGNMHLQTNDEIQKGGNRVIMMKTTKRVIKIPASRTNYKFFFQPIDRVDIMFPFNLDDSNRKLIESRLNPLRTIDDFNKKTWADDIIILLKPWINGENLSGNLNMAAKLAYHNQMYTECLKSLLGNLKTVLPEKKVYLIHTENGVFEKPTPSRQEDVKLTIRGIISKRIRDISMAILNDEPFPSLDSTTYQNLPCCCDELKYLPEKTSQCQVNIAETDLSITAADIIDKCISIFPVNTDLWETCFRLSKNFYLDNNLCLTELERILRKYMESNASTMAAAIMYSKDCAQYSEILTPKFYLNMCSQVMDTWG